MLGALLVVVLAAHLLAVNFASAGPFIAMGLALAGRNQPASLQLVLARRLVRWSLVAVVLGMLLGGGALALAWRVQPEFFEAAKLIRPRRYWFGIAELVFYVGCLWLYLWLVPAAGASSTRRFWIAWLALLVGGLDLVYHFPPLFAAIGVLATRPETWGHELRLWDVAAEVGVLVVHFLMASAAVGGIALAWIAARDERARASGGFMRGGAGIALVATALQLPVGVGVIVCLPSLSRDALLGGDTVAMAALGAALVAMVGLLHALAAVAMGDTRTRMISSAAVLLAVVVLTMVIAQQRSRGQLHAFDIDGRSPVAMRSASG